MEQYTAFGLDNLFKEGFFTNLDYFFAKSMAHAFNEKDANVLTSCALVSKSLFEGHICLDIFRLADSTAVISETGKDRVKFPGFKVWLQSLQKSPMVSDTVDTPLVLDSGHRLYFSKYFDFQYRLALNIAQRVSLIPLKMDGKIIDSIIELYFTKNDIHVADQKKAVRSAVLNQFTIVSGGPGTGKTYVIEVIKKIVFEYAKIQKLDEPKIICVAPTGKAASKMEQGSTIHAILKPLKNTPGFYYNKKNLLPVNVMIIDEASMIDISLLTRLLEAVPLAAKVIVLGDKHQLSSIQAGSVFNDICRVTELAPILFFLEYNFRLKGKTGIENLAKAINGNHVKRVEQILLSGEYSDIIFETSIDKAKQYIIEGYKALIESDTIEEVLTQLDRFKILCAHNSGEYGTLQVNHVCEKILRSGNNFDIQDDPFKKVIMVNKNDYKKGLFNGDTGVVLEKNEETNAFFLMQDNKINRYRNSDLPGFDTAFAITIHKSQGSEFNIVLIIIPDKISPVMTRQLLYTGVTRAKTKVIIVGKLNMIKKAMNIDVKRDSGLPSCLRNEIQKYEKDN
ncbi:MAG: exodeoxyribonuclease V subunit alpha [Desulfobacteraceae bacterium]|nr:exodeoxyribonuclease V subunit alpha [Desulfobacteraceae bacterium]